MAKEIDSDIGIVAQTVKICGGYSGDDTLLLQGPILGPQIVLIANNKTHTYRNLINKLDEIRHSENYPMVLLALKTERDAPRHVDPKPVAASFTKMVNYQLALKEAIDSQKPLFLYFTSENSINSRQMEKGLLADDEVKTILNNYVRYVADADDAAIEKLQIEKFKSDVQPYFVVVLHDRKIAEFTGGSHDKEAFMNFLKKGLR